MIHTGGPSRPSTSSILNPRGAGFRATRFLLSGAMDLKISKEAPNAGFHVNKKAPTHCELWWVYASLLSGYVSLV